MIITYILDLDDTLYCEHDYVKSGFLAVAKALAERSDYGVDRIYHELLSVWTTEGRGKVFDTVISKLHIQMETQLLVDLYRSHRPTIQLYEDAKIFLEYAQQHELKLGLITDGASQVQWNKIESLRIKPYFQAIVVSDDFGGTSYWKPHEAPYLKAAKLLAVLPQNCCYVGDNPHKDFITAKRLGMKTIRIVRPVGDHMNTKLEPEYEADETMTSLASLLPYSE
ncbi:HAD family hydrolase [Marinicrinis lubricantis]|uniref:HAD family hydrolase n=1 Tax=Marinicrinis lubricantis TaxID=2086470 RepID=A0ABW1IT40_9BACL